VISKRTQQRNASDNTYNAFQRLAEFGEMLQSGLEQEKEAERQRQERVANLQSALKTINLNPILPVSQKTKDLPPPDPRIIEAEKWLKLIKHPSLVLILGKRGSGKSGLGHRLLECLRFIAPVYVIGLPKEARALLPDWIGMAACLEDVPDGSIVLVDEAYIRYHARAGTTTSAREMSQILNLSRQKKLTIIFVSQEARQIDKNIVSSADVVIFKEPSSLQAKFDRRELNEITVKAKDAFANVKGDKRPWSFVSAPDADFAGIVQNTLPTFWHEKLSHIFAAGGEPTTRAPKKTSLSERIEKAKELQRQGLSQGKIAKQMGISRPTIGNYLRDYPYKK
jgi:hypothetical protein